MSAPTRVRAPKLKWRSRWRVADQILAGHRDPVTILSELKTDPVYSEFGKGLDKARDGRPLREIGRFENRRRTVPVVLPSGLALEVEVDRTRASRTDESTTKWRLKCLTRTWYPKWRHGWTKSLQPPP